MSKAEFRIQPIAALPYLTGSERESQEVLFLHQRRWRYASASYGRPERAHGAHVEEWAVDAASRGIADCAASLTRRMDNRPQRERTKSRKGGLVPWLC
jgi:hypothetical protein